MNLQTLHIAISALVLAGATTAGLGFIGLGSAQAAEPAVAAPSVSTLAALEPIAGLDLPRYMGRPYELARYPNRLQQQCAAAATADYTLLPTGSVQVVTRCPQLRGKVDVAINEVERPLAWR